MSELFRPVSGDVSIAVSNSLNLILEGFPLGSDRNPLKIGYAGLLMASKGLHTIVESLLHLRNLGLSFQLNVAGAIFQSSYKDALDDFLHKHDLFESTHFFGHLTRPQLSRFWSNCNIGIFPSIYQAFGIVAAEIMCSGVPLLTTGVGGASELIVSGESGITFTPGDSLSLSDSLSTLVNSPHLYRTVAENGCTRAHSKFSVLSSVTQIEELFISSS